MMVAVLCLYYWARVTEEGCAGEGAVCANHHR